jgi:hypothetical protein
VREEGRKERKRERKRKRKQARKKKKERKKSRTQKKGPEAMSMDEIHSNCACLLLDSYTSVG